MSADFTDNFEQALSEHLENVPFYHGKLLKEQANEYLQSDGDYLLRVARDKSDYLLKPVLSVKWGDRNYHFLIRQRFGMWQIGSKRHQTIPNMVYHHHNLRIPVTKKSGALLIRPISKRGPPATVCDTFTKATTNPTTEMDSQQDPPPPPSVLFHLLKMVAICFVIIFLYVCIVCEQNSNSEEDSEI